MRLLGFTVFAASLAIAAAASAQTPASSSQEDARCLLVMVGLTNSSDQNAQRFGANGVVFYTGRLTARDPNYDFNRLKAMAASMNAQAAQTEFQQRCGPTLQTSMKKLETALAPPAGSTPPAAKPPAAKPPAH
jgi:hypothetical protein